MRNGIFLTKDELNVSFCNEEREREREMGGVSDYYEKVYVRMS